MRRDIPKFIVEAGVRDGATDVAAMMMETDKTMIRFHNSRVSISKSYREEVASIFIMIEGRRASTVVNDLTPDSIKDAVKRTIKAAKLTPPAETYAPLPSGPFKYDKGLLKPSRIDLEPDHLTRYVEEAIGGALEEGAKKVAGSLIASNTDIRLVTSSGVHAEERSSNVEISVRAFTSDDASGHSVSISRDEGDFHPEEAGREAGEVAALASNPILGKLGSYKALLGPLVFADLVNQIGLLSSAFRVDAGQSFLIDKIGSKVASDCFTLIDDPTTRGTYGSRAFDDEGLPSRRTPIVERGVMKTYLHNSTTAKKHGVESTSNAGYIVPRPWNLIVEGGELTFDDLLSEMGDGIYVTNNWYLRYQNYRTGDFSTIPRDGMFLVREGQVERPIKDLRISDNVLRIFQNIRALGRSRRWIKWWEVEVPTFTPYALIEDLKFTKSTL